MSDVIDRIVEKNQKFFRLISETLSEDEKRRLFEEIFGKPADNQTGKQS